MPPSIYILNIGLCGVNPVAVSLSCELDEANNMWPITFN